MYSAKLDATTQSETKSQITRTFVLQLTAQWYKNANHKTKSLTDNNEYKVTETKPRGLSSKRGNQTDWSHRFIISTEATATYARSWVIMSTVVKY